jgi:hypothetical protein
MPISTIPNLDDLGRWADYLMRWPTKRAFDMELWESCAFGYAVRLFRPALRLVKGMPGAESNQRVEYQRELPVLVDGTCEVRKPEVVRYYGVEACAEFFGLTFNDALSICAPASYKAEHFGRDWPGSITPELVALRIMEVVERYRNAQGHLLQQIEEGKKKCGQLAFFL